MPSGNGLRLYETRWGLARSACLVIVFIGVLYLIAGQNRQPVERPSPYSQASAADSNQSAQQKNTAAAQTTPDAEPNIGTPIGPATTDQKAANSDANADQEARELMRRDIHAQEGMLYAAWAAVFLTLIAIFLIWRTLIHTRTAAEAAQESVVQTHRAVNAAQDANNIARLQSMDARRSAERQLRAYVEAADPLWTYPSDDESGYSVTLVWKNCGETPARRCVARTNCGAFPEPICNDFDYPDLPSDQITEKAQIGRERSTKSTVGFKRSDVEAAALRKKILYVWGWIEYNDVFEGTPRRRTELCLELTIIEGGKNFIPTVVGPFNGSDEDCHQKTKT